METINAAINAIKKVRLLTNAHIIRQLNSFEWWF